jgi:hypothetical protein
MSEYLQLPEGVERSDGFWADFWIVRVGSQLFAQGYIHAPGRGDEIISLVQQRLQQEADLRREVVIHEYTAANKASKALIERTVGYKRKKFANGHEIYQCVYNPK